MENLKAVKKLQNEEIAGLKCSKGSKRQGFFKVGERPLSDVNVPIMIVRGSENGKTLFLRAGDHPEEYPAILAAISIYQQIDPLKLRGNIIIVPVANVPAFEGSKSKWASRTSYVSPVDGLNFPAVFEQVARGERIGEAAGELTYVIAEAILRETSMKSDYCISLHGGALPEKQGNWSIYSKIGDRKIDAVSEAMAKLCPYPVDFVSVVESRSPIWRIPSIVSEAGDRGLVDKSAVVAHTEGVFNVMRYLNMIGGEPKISRPITVGGPGTRIRAKRGGIWYPCVDFGDKVAEAQKVGEIRNVFGEVIEELFSPISGMVMVVNIPPPVYSGAPLVLVSPTI